MPRLKCVCVKTCVCVKASDAGAQGRAQVCVREKDAPPVRQSARARAGERGCGWGAREKEESWGVEGERKERDIVIVLRHSAQVRLNPKP